MFIRRLYIKFKIWRLQSQINRVPADINYYWIALVSMNIRYCEGKLNIKEIYVEYVKNQFDKVKRLENEVEKLKISLKNL